MAATRGYVQQLWWFQGGPTSCIWVGPTLTSLEAFFIQITASDDDAAIAFKRSLVNVFVTAQATGREIEVLHADDSAEVRGVTTPAAVADSGSVQMDGVEITQATQDLSQCVPLVAGKRTVVRLYLSSPANPPVTVSGEITLRRAAPGLPLTIPSLNSITLESAQVGGLALHRNDVGQSLNFLIPDSHTVEGPLAISRSSVTDALTGGSMAVEGERRPVVWFHASPPLRVRVLRVRYTQGTPPVVHAPSDFDVQALLSWLGRAYPVGQVASSQAVIDATANAPFTCNDINAQIAAIRALDMAAGGDQRTHYYGLVSDGGFFMRGCAAGVPPTPDPATVASGPTGPADWGWDYDGSYGDWYGGHELGHTFGRLHPGFCGETQDDLTNYPYAGGQLAATDASFQGFDVGDPSLGFPMACLRGTQWHDVMTYCNRQWLSAYTYQGVRLRLLAEDSQGAGAGAGGAGGGMGRPDERFPGRRTGVPESQAAAAEQSLISIVADVNLTKKTGKIRFMNPLPGGRASEPDRGSRVLLRARHADGTALGDFPARVKLSSELSARDDRTGLVDVVMPVDRRARAIELLVDDQVVDAVRASGSAPLVRAVRPVIGGDNVPRVALELDRPLEGHETYAVQVRVDGGETWQTIGVGLREPVFTLDRRQFRDQDVQVRVIVTNGFERSVATSETFRV